MNDKVFLDTNIVMDFVLERNPFFEDAARIFQLGDERKIDLYISSLTISTLAYGAQKAKD